MSLMLALQGILPLLVFAIVDIFASLRTALIAAFIFAVAEVAFGYYSYGEVDQLSWISLGLVALMGGVSFYLKSDRLFKFQPVALAAVSAGALVYFQWMGEPLIIQMLPKVAAMMPEEQRAQFSSPQFLRIMARMDALMIFVFITHGILVAWAAVKKSTMVWLVVRGIGFYVLLVIALIINGFMTAQGA